MNISNTAFGFAIGIQMLMWGITGPIFGAVADRYGGHVAIISAFIFYTLGIYFLYTGPNTGIFFQIHMGLAILNPVYFLCMMVGASKTIQITLSVLLGAILGPIFYFFNFICFGI